MPTVRPGSGYALVVVGNGFGGATAALSFLTAAERAGTTGRAASR